MSERPTTDEVRDAFAYETAMTMAELEIARNMFDDWLYFVRKEAHDEGYELIAQAEELSYKTCERCGRPGMIDPLAPINGASLIGLGLVAWASMKLLKGND